jgi:hypothetical protein
MLHHFVMTVVLAAAALVIPTAANAGKRESVYSDMSGAGCTGTADEEFGCKGPSGWWLEIADEGNIIELKVYRKATPAGALQLVGRGLGEKAEWRGTRSKRGFTPDALIIRMRPAEDDGQISSLLYVVKLQANSACLQGIIDAKVNTAANAVARAAADKLPDSCGTNPRVYGERSAATDAFGR